MKKSVSGLLIFFIVLSILGNVFALILPEPPPVPNMSSNSNTNSGDQLINQDNPSVPSDEDYEFFQEEEEESGFTSTQWVITIIILLVILGVVFLIVFLMEKRNQEKQMPINSNKPIVRKVQ